MIQRNPPINHSGNTFMLPARIRHGFFRGSPSESENIAAIVRWVKATPVNIANCLPGSLSTPKPDSDPDLRKRENRNSPSESGFGNRKSIFSPCQPLTEYCRLIPPRHLSLSFCLLPAEDCLLITFPLHLLTPPDPLVVNRLS